LPVPVLRPGSARKRGDGANLSGRAKDLAHGRAFTGTPGKFTPSAEVLARPRSRGVSVRSWIWGRWPWPRNFHGDLFVGVGDWAAERDDRSQRGVELGIGFLPEFRGELGLLIGGTSGPKSWMLRAS